MLGLVFLVMGCAGGSHDDSKSGRAKTSALLATTGSPCTAMDDCQSKLCLTVDMRRPSRGRVCTSACASDGDCAAPWRCVVTTSLTGRTEGYCQPPDGFVAPGGTP